MTKIILDDEHYETIYVSEKDDEELYDILEALMDATAGGDSYADAIYNVIGGPEPSGPTSSPL